MTLQEVMDILSGIKNGTYRKLMYTTELPVKAKYKKDGIKIVKYADATGRFGINYGHVATVIERNRLEPDREVKPNPNKSWIIKNKIEYNSNTGKYYLNVYTSPNKTKSTYLLYKEGSVSQLNDLTSVREYIIDSYFNHTSDNGIGCVMYKVNLDNVKSLG